jgi:hypothetical protein
VRKAGTRTGYLPHMDRDAFESIILRYESLAETLKRISSSLRKANPKAKLKASLRSELAGCAFMEMPCWSLDGATSRIRIVDGSRESRHATRLLAFDRRHRLLGDYLWRPGKPGSPSQALGSGRIVKKAVDYAIVTHREWFKRGSVPSGIPDADVAHRDVLGAEVEIGLYGTSGVPSTWFAPD